MIYCLLSLPTFSHMVCEILGRIAWIELCYLFKETRKMQPTFSKQCWLRRGESPLFGYNPNYQHSSMPVNTRSLLGGSMYVFF